MILNSYNSLTLHITLISFRYVERKQVNI